MSESQISQQSSLEQEAKLALVIHAKDNVAIALTDLKPGDICKARLGDHEEEIEVLENIPFGHKLALTPLKEDESVYKYGEEIGKMSEAIAKGGWIHVHNMYCERGR